jgi:hypothetical protein
MKNYEQQYKQETGLNSRYENEYNYKQEFTDWLIHKLTSETARADMLQEENRKLKSYLKMLGVNYEWK